MKISYNPTTAAALTTTPNNNDITFDLKGLNIFTRGTKFKGTDTTYSVFKKHTSSGRGGYNGLVPVPSYTATNVRFLREDGTWSIPAGFIYTQLTNQDLDNYLGEGRWYYAGGGNTTTNKPSGVDAYELYVGRNAIGYRYQKLITSNGLIWFRYHDSSWKTWVRWYTDRNTDQKVLQSATTTSNYRPLALGYTNTSTTADLGASVTQQVYVTTTIYAQPSTGSLWANKLYSGRKPVLTEHQSLANYVTLNTAQTITGAKTFSTSVRFVSNASIIQNQNDTSNYTTILKWYKNGASRNTYDPSIGQHNTGGDGNGSICILPYPTATSPWNGTVGLFISKGVLKLDGKSVALAENHYTKPESNKIYVGGNRVADHSSSGTAYTAETYSSTYVNKAFVAFAERGTWSYAHNGYVSTDTGVNIPLAGTAIFQWGASDTHKTQLYITPQDNSNVSNPAVNEMLFYTSNGSGYATAWTRVLTHRNYTNYTVTKTGGGASGTWGISITGNANTATKVANALTFSAGRFSSKTYNGSSAITVNVPTHTSHLTNNSGFWTGTRYWANIAVSTASSTSTSPTFNTCYTSNWFRSTGSTGWCSQTYGGGWYMSDNTWIRTYGNKSVYQNTGQIRTDGYLVTNGGITVGATSPNNGTYKLHVTGNSWSSGYIRAGAGFYHNAVNSNSYVLLAGGSYKSLADFVKGNAGASNRGVYVTNGTVTAMTYYLNATVNSGASGKLAYYSGTNSIDDYTNTIGSSSTPIYINNGIPNAANSYKVVNRGHYFSAFGISGYIYVIRYGQVVCVSINMSSGGNGSTGTTTLLTNLPSAVYITGQSASKGGGSGLRWAAFYISGTTLYVYSYQANMLPNKVSFTYITSTPG